MGERAKGFDAEKIVNYTEAGGAGLALAGLIFYAPAVGLGIVIVGTTEIIKARMKKSKK